MRLASGLSPGFPLALSLPPFSLFRAAIIFSPLWCYPSPCLPAARGTGREYRFARLIDSGCNCSTNERPLIIIRFRNLRARGRGEMRFGWSSIVDPGRSTWSFQREGSWALEIGLKLKLKFFRFSRDLFVLIRGGRHSIFRRTRGMEIPPLDRWRFTRMFRERRKFGIGRRE